ncbi:putative cholinesterase [Bienertia sinuspersici]
MKLDMIVSVVVAVQKLHGRSQKKLRGVRFLDRALYNGKWSTAFDNARVKHLPANHSDHCPIFISPNRLTNISSENWHQNAPPVPQLHSLSKKFQEWNRDVLHNIFKKKKHLVTCILGAKRALSSFRHAGLIKLEAELRRELDGILAQEKML